MAKFLIWALSISLILHHTLSSTDEGVKQSLLVFFRLLSEEKHPTHPYFVGWNETSDPCSDRWSGVDCVGGSSVMRVVLDDLGLGGVLYPDAICAVETLRVLSVRNNSIRGVVSEAIGKCKQLTHLYIGNNRLSWSIPKSLSRLHNLKRLDVSNNMFYDALPDLSKFPGLVDFSGQLNWFRGGIPELDFANFQEFNVSFNQLSGPIPGGASRFGASSFMGNFGLCGKPLPKACSP